MEQNHQNLSEETKAGDFSFGQEDVSYPRCPLHKADANLIPKNEEGWTKHSSHIIKCLKCISNGKLDLSEFRLLDEILVD